MKRGLTAIIVASLLAFGHIVVHGRTTPIERGAQQPSSAPSEQMVTATGCLQRDTPIPSAAGSSAGSRPDGPVYVLVHARVSSAGAGKDDRKKKSSNDAGGPQGTPVRLRLVPIGDVKGDALQAQLQHQVEVKGRMTPMGSAPDTTQDAAGKTGTSSTSSVATTGAANTSAGTPGAPPSGGRGTAARTAGGTGDIMPILRVSSIRAVAGTCVGAS